MFKLPGEQPRPRDSAQIWADYAEHLAIIDNSISLAALTKGPALVSDEVQVTGITDETDQLNDKAIAVTAEIERRKNHTGNKYPFNIGALGHKIEYTAAGNQSDVVYKFLLYATRLNMKDDKVLADLDGTALFEKLCAEVSNDFFGRNATAKVFGTGEAGGFRQKLEALAVEMGEGGLVRKNANYQPKDDKIDVVVWKDFTDKNHSKIIGFGQCKTGTTWLQHLNSLNVAGFCKRWFNTAPALDPIAMFFTADFFPQDIWYERVAGAGLIFDRFRIMDFLPEKIDEDLYSQITLWTSATQDQASTRALESAQPQAIREEPIVKPRRNSAAQSSTESKKGEDPLTLGDAVTDAESSAENPEK